MSESEIAYCVARPLAEFTADELAVVSQLDGGRLQYAHCSRCGVIVVLSPASRANNARMTGAGVTVSVVCISCADVLRRDDSDHVMALAPGAVAEIQQLIAGLRLRRQRRN